jgi:hypothetical protein
MLTVADDSVLEDVEKAESKNLLPRKIIDDVRTIYSSHKLGLPKDSLWGEPVLCDFGEARIGNTTKVSSNLSCTVPQRTVWHGVELKCGHLECCSLGKFVRFFLLMVTEIK